MEGEYFGKLVIDREFGGRQKLPGQKLLQRLGQRQSS
jgi:hypothetical protein